MTSSISIKGHEVLVDDVDADLLKGHWHLNGLYVVRTGRVQKLRLHRLIVERMLGRTLQADEVVDHIDLNPLNNQRQNLRLATYSQNLANRKRHKRNKTGLKGVCETKYGYAASIGVNRKTIYLGTFHTPEEAHEAYKDAARKYFGEFANNG